MGPELLGWLMNQVVDPSLESDRQTEVEAEEDLKNTLRFKKITFFKEA